MRYHLFLNSIRKIVKIAKMFSRKLAVPRYLSTSVCLEVSKIYLFCSPRMVECDLYMDNYHPHYLTILSDLFSIKEVSHSVRDYMPNCETDFSPFVVREREVKRREESSARNVKSSFAALLSGLTSGKTQ